MKKILSTAFIALSLSVSGNAMALDAKLTADIKKLIEVSGAAAASVQMKEQTIAQFQKMTAGRVPPQFWADFRKDPANGVDSLINQLVPVYAQNFSAAEIKALIDFYSSELGKKVVSTMPKVTQQSMAMSQKWWMGLGQKAQQQMQAKGYR